MYHFSLFFKIKKIPKIKNATFLEQPVLFVNNSLSGICKSFSKSFKILVKFLILILVYSEINLQKKIYDD